MDLKNIKIPKMKFGKMNINTEELEKIDYESIGDKNIIPKKRKEFYKGTNYKTVKEFFLRSVEKYPDNQCILEKPDHKTPYKVTTYKEFKDQVNGLGTALIKLLNLSGEKVIIIGETQIGWYISYMAMLCGVGIAVPVDRELPDNELENVVERSGAAAIIYSPKKEDSIKKIKKENNNVKYFIEMKSDKPLQDRDVGINYLIDAGEHIIKSGDNSFEEIPIDPEAFKVLIFTSGTTSNSKGVMICNRNLAENINAITPYVNLYPTDMLFSVLPLHHTYESTIGFLYPISQGASVAICEGLRYIVPNMQECHPTAILAVPLLIETMYKKIMKGIEKEHKTKLVNTMMVTTTLLKKAGIDVRRRVFKDIYDQLGGKLRIIVSAAAPIDKKVGKWFENLGVLFLQGYGLTETAPISAVTPDFDMRVGSAGKLIPKGKVKIENPNENGEGEILVKTPTLMLGYYENDIETKKAITEDGYFHTGDIGYVDEDNYIYVTGRIKNVIVTQNGKNIYPEEIEMLIEKIEEVKDVMVYGKKADKNSKKDEKELITTAKVVPNYAYIKEKYGDISDKEIYDIIWKQIKEVNKKLTSYKAVKLLEIKKDDFEKTSTMKIKRYKEVNGK